VVVKKPNCAQPREKVGRAEHFDCQVNKVSWFNPDIRRSRGQRCSVWQGSSGSHILSSVTAADNTIILATVQDHSRLSYSVSIKSLE